MRKIFTIVSIAIATVSFTGKAISQATPQDATSQNTNIEGTVTDAETGEQLIGVTIQIKGTTVGTITDIEGHYLIQASPDDSLVFSFIGYVTQTIGVGNRTLLDVQLSTDVETLSEVVIVGYGTQRKSDLTGSVSSIRGKDLTQIPSNNPMQALQGKVAGVQVTSSTGAPGAAPVVRIRGVGTFNNASPIYVVDGVILDDISFLNPADIESMEILKDASATAIYGSRGANGVVLVTTKQGSKEDKAPIVTVSGEYSIQKLHKTIDLLNGREFATVANEINPGSYNNVNAVPNTDWQSLIFRDAPIHNYQVSVAGSSPKIQYYVGVGYFNQQGIIPKSSYERVSVRLNNTFHLADNVRLGSNISITPYKQQNTNAFSPYIAYRAQPVVSPRQMDGSYSPVAGVGNVLADINYTNNFDRALRSVGNVFGEVDIIKGLTFRSSFGADLELKKNESFTPAFFVSPQQQNSTSDLNKTNTDRLSWLWENTLNYTKDIGKHRINALVGYTMQEASSEFLKVAGENIIRNGEDFWYFDASNTVGNLTENRVELDQNYSMTSYLFRLNYVFDRRYLFTGSLRRDASSKFSKENRVGYFPAIALGWNIINEAFMQDVSLLTNLKLRGSWGIVGNEKIDYSRRFSPVSNVFGAVFGTNETLYPGSSYGVSGNPDLTWESTYQTDVGLEFALFENQLKGEIDYYRKRTDDILISLPVAGYLGNGVGATITYNAAEVLNQGIEYNLGWSSEINDVTYSISAMGTTINNKALKVMGTGGPGDRLFNSAQTTRTVPGLPIGAFYGYKTDGIFQNQTELDSYPHTSQAGVGDLRFVDVNGDGSLTPDDRTNIGSSIPDFIYGINLEVGYKGIGLSVDFQGQAGNEIYNAKETVRPDLYNFEQHVFDRWRGEGTSNTEPRATAGGYNFQHSSRFVQDGSFLRLRSATISYDLSQSVAEKAKMKSARIYIRGTNLLTWTKFTGYSPEVSGTQPGATGTGVLDNGIDYGTYPVSTVYSFGLNLTF
ncbi:MAG TPA: TonB-dependent receptor [Cytophagales bacterium]|nr:TonB-dependent receptor [Cytophagales bacterium]